MTPPPDRPQLYHITHIDNLPSILRDGGLRSDAAMLARGGPAAAIGMSSIKSRRLQLPVKCYPGDRVGDIGVYSKTIYDQARAILEADTDRPQVETRRAWYY